MSILIEILTLLGELNRNVQQFLKFYRFLRNLPMLDPKRLRNDIISLAAQLAERGFVLDVERLQALEKQRYRLQGEVQALQNERNTKSREIGLAKSSGQSLDALKKPLRDIGDRLASLEKTLDDIQQQLQAEYLAIPNLPHSSVPDGQTEADNKEVRRWGEPTTFEFEPKDHVALTQKSGRMDFASGAKLSGSRFVVLRGNIARLHRALGQFMLDTHTQTFNYEEVSVPFMVSNKAMVGTGQLPKFKEDHFEIAGDEFDFSLIPTAEVPVTNLIRETIIDADSLPIRWVAHTPCFRKEAGSYGKDTRGMIRLHQFEKVELVQIVRPEDSYEALERLTQQAETILQKLELPYRVMALCKGDLGFSAAKTYDLEVWLPGQNNYREVSSCSNAEDFQARRMGARWRGPDHTKPEWVHTLNGSGLPLGRTLAAVIENYQETSGNIRLPEVLKPYMGGMDRIIVDE